MLLHPQMEWNLGFSLWVFIYFIDFFFLFYLK